jgi:4-aminobutyrate aminotransferase-like enzyme/Ser/Thr protein kinase RdoA (MazF antagonist)
MSTSQGASKRITFFSDDDARALVAEHFGVTGTLERLPGYDDQNYRVHVSGGDGWVLKITPSDAPRARLEMQHEALARIAAAGLGFGTPVSAFSASGAPMVWADDSAGRPHALRLLSYLPGEILASANPRSPQLLESLGAAVAGLHSALDGFDHPAAHQDAGDWDLTRTSEIVAARIGAVSDPERRAMLERIKDQFESDAREHLGDLPSGVIHGDVNDCNVVVSPPALGGTQVSGVLDFGDLLHGPLVADLAIAAAYGCLGTGDLLAACASVVRGYRSERPLSEDEANVLYPLIRGRLATTVVHSAACSDADREDPYLSVSEAPAWEAIAALDRVHPHLARAILREAAGYPPCPNSVEVVRWLQANREQCGPIVGPPLTDAETIVFDVSPGSLEVGRLDQVLDAEAATRTMFDRMDRAGVPVGVGKYDEPRLWYASDDYAEGSSDFPERRTVHIAVDLFMQPGTALFAPLDATVHSFRDNAERLDYGPTIILEHAPEDGPTFWTLYGHLTRDSLAGLSVGFPVAKGAEFARMGDYPTNGDWAPHVHFQIVTDLLGSEATFPGVCLPSQRAVWNSFSPDPGLMLDLPSGTTYEPAAQADAILQARRDHIGPNLSLSYGNEPLHIVRGWRQHLFTEDGQSWLDCVNNVCHVGHSHPHVVEAASRQMSVLNTNTRYLHANLIRYAERLTASLPDPLEICFFTNSGSEANELALRLARSYTGRNDLVVVDAAYHGNTGAVMAASPYKFNGPGGAGRPEHIHVAPTPDQFRAQPGGDASGAGEAIARAGARGGAAAFLHESILSCAGQIELPDGYLADVYARARAAGAVCIADEVQVGFGRVGTHFWGFESHGVVPDIVTMGKPMGNGHPLGAVVTTREIAAGFANGMEYFNTFGGNPVSCAVGLAVLDVIEDEGLQAHALRVGGHLKAALTALKARHPVIGDVRGRGLFLGIEFATPDEHEPLADVAFYVVHRMKHHGILLSSDGPDQNVIKIKPPMVFTASDADQLVRALERVLREDFVRSFS